MPTTYLTTDTIRLTFTVTVPRRTQLAHVGVYSLDDPEYDWPPVQSVWADPATGGYTYTGDKTLSAVGSHTFKASVQTLDGTWHDGPANLSLAISAPVAAFTARQQAIITLFQQLGRNWVDRGGILAYDATNMGLAEIRWHLVQDLPEAQNVHAEQIDVSTADGRALAISLLFRDVLHRTWWDATGEQAYVDSGRSIADISAEMTEWVRTHPPIQSVFHFKHEPGANNLNFHVFWQDFLADGSQKITEVDGVTVSNVNGWYDSEGYWHTSVDETYTKQVAQHNLGNGLPAGMQRKMPDFPTHGDTYPAQTDINPGGDQTWG